MDADYALAPFYVAPPGTLQFTVATTNVSENIGTVTLTVTRTGGSSGAASVSYSPQSGTATAGQDFTAASGSLNWADGNADPKTISIAITDDTTAGEGNETFSITLSGATGATLGAPATATVTIQDNGSSGSTFTDNFDRADSGTVGNGWSQLTGAVGSLAIVGNELSGAGNGIGGVSRPVSHAGPVTIRALLKEKASGAAPGGRYQWELGVKNDGNINSGYRVRLSKTDSTNPNAQIQLLDGGGLVTSANSTFQFGSQIQVEVTFHPDGRVIGTVTGNGSTSSFSFAPSGILVANMETPNHPMGATLDVQVRSSNPPAARHNASKCTVRARTEQFPGGPSTQRVPRRAGAQACLFSHLKAAFSGFYPLSSPNTLSFGARTVSATGGNVVLASEIGGTLQPRLDNFSLESVTAPVITSAATTSATVGQPFSYQITANNTPTSFNATGLPAGLTVNSAGLISGTPTAAGNSTVTLSASNAGGTGIATLTLAVNPVIISVITTQPRDQTVVVGANVTFTVSATGQPPLTYQWRRDSTDIPSATSSSLVLNAVTLAQGGAYRVVVTDAVGNLTSVPAQLIVATSLFQPPAPQSAAEIRSLGYRQGLLLEPGRAFRVQAATELINPVWMDVTNFVSTGAAFQFIDAAAANQTRRFYRVVSP